MINKFLNIFVYLGKRKVQIIALVVLSVCLLPMLYFFNFSILGGDDFLYGLETSHAIQDTGSYWNAVKIAAAETIDSYFGWQGSYFSVFLMYLQPGIVSLALYRIVLLLFFVLDIVTPFIAAFTLNKYYLKAPKPYIWLITCAYTFVVTQYMPSIFQAYYWYNGAVYYQFTFSIAMLFVAAFAKYRHVENKKKRNLLLALIYIMCFMIGGANYPIGLVLACSLALYLVYAFIKKNKYRKTDTIIFAVFIVFFLINVLAPGNGARQTSTGTSYGLFTAAYASVRDMLVEIPSWFFGTVTIGIVCAVLPFGKKLTENSNLRFVHPALAFFVLAALLLVQYYPVEYGLGSKGPERVENLRFMALNISIWLFFINMMGYYRDKEKPVKKTVAAVLVVIAISTSLGETGINSFTSYKMADHITSGKLAAFAEIIDYELSQLEDTESDEKVDYSLHTTNEFLHPDTTFWLESGIWAYYRKTPDRS